MDIDLRKLRYFVAVAEELHFGRAAERLVIAQPALSRQIRALEDELGAELFAHDRRGTELTPAGQQLLEEARPLLMSAEGLRRRVAAAASGVEEFTIGFRAGLVVTAAVRVFRERHPDLGIRLLCTTWEDQVSVLHEARADVSLVRLPIDTRGLRVQPLFSEPPVVVLPSGHRLAGKESVSIAELADEHLLQDPAAVPEWRDVAVERREGEEPPQVGSVEEKLELVAAEAGVCVLPLSTASFYTRPDVAVVRVEDLGPNHVSLAWPATRESAVIADFAEAARVLTPPV